MVQKIVVETLMKAPGAAKRKYRPSLAEIHAAGRRYDDYDRD